MTASSSRGTCKRLAVSFYPSEQSFSSLLICMRFLLKFAFQFRRENFCEIGFHHALRLLILRSGVTPGIAAISVRMLASFLACAMAA